MELKQHSPAPWYDDGYRIHAATDSEDKRDGRVIVSYKHIEDFNFADAPLLTAAPELLAALRAVRDHFNRENYKPVGIWEQVSSALAKFEAYL